MKVAIAFLVIFAVAFPSVMSIKCYQCVGSLCTQLTCVVGDRCISTTYKNTSKTVRSCATESVCNTTAKACSKVSDSCTTSCCMTDGCNKGPDSQGISLKINYAMVAWMALLTALFYAFKF